jgi:hypothetical protein
MDEPPDTGRDRAGGVHHAERSPDDQDVEDDVGHLDQGAREGEEDVAGTRRVGRDPVIRRRVDQFPTLGDDPFVSARWQNPRAGRGEHD